MLLFSAYLRRDFFISNNESHVLHFAFVLCSACNYINARRVNAGVPKNIGEFRNIFFNSVKRAGE